MVLAFAALVALCAAVQGLGVFAGSFPLMLLVETLLGVSLMGMLPFALQQAVLDCQPASENVVAGLIYIIAMSLAAIFMIVSTQVPALTLLAMMGGMMAVELLAFRSALRSAPGSAVTRSAEEQAEGGYPRQPPEGNKEPLLDPTRDEALQSSPRHM
jgi:hypothetical protein